MLYTYGQPHIRAGQQYRYCALDDDDDATVTVAFTDGAVTAVSGTTTDTGRDLSGGLPDAGTTDVDQADVDQKDTVRASDDGLPDAGGPSARWPIGGLAAIAIGVMMVASCRHLTLGGNH